MMLYIKKKKKKSVCHCKWVETVQKGPTAFTIVLCSSRYAMQWSELPVYLLLQYLWERFIANLRW